METFIYIIKSIAILSIFYIIYRIVLQKDTFFSANRHYLLSGIIAALIIPFIHYTKTIYREIPALDTSMSGDASFVNTAMTAIQPQQEAVVINWWQIALIIYGIGVISMLIRLGIQLISLHTLITGYPKTYKDGHIYVQITDKAITPFSFFKTICYNPNLHTSEELAMILAHEKIHVRQRHTIDILLTQCILAVQWFNPLAWLYKKSLEQNLEFIADNGAIQEVSSSQEYQRTLVKVSSTIVQPALTNNFYHSLIKKRIVMLNKKTSHKRNLWKLGLVLPALALFMYSFNVKEVIKYKESSTDVESAFAKAETNLEKTDGFYIHAETTALELDVIENHFMVHHPEKLIKFHNRVFHKNGYIKQFSFQTKFPLEKRFFTRFDVTSPIDKDWSGYLIANTDDAFIQIKELKEDGVAFEITKENLVFTSNFVLQNSSFNLNNKTLKKDHLKATQANLIPETQQVQQSVQNYTRTSAENTTSSISSIQQTTNNVLKEDYNTPKLSTKKERSNGFNTPSVVDKEVRILISKNTSEKELKAIQERLKKEHTLNLNYSTNRNSASEITSISISYSGNSKNGSYNISGDEPIEDFYFFINEEGDPGFWSEAHDRRMKERQLQLEERTKEMKERRQEMEEKRTLMEEKREEMRSLQNNQGKEAQKRLESAQQRVVEQKKRMEERKEDMKIRQEEMKVHQEEMKKVMEERKEEMKTQREEMKKRMTQVRSQNAGNWNQSDSESITITKNTTDAQIQSITSELKSKGITFSLTKIKRNSKGEIIEYKMKFNNNNGTESVSQKKTNSDDPIDALHIVYSDGDIQVHN